jgi:hypothetical protein
MTNGQRGRQMTDKFDVIEVQIKPPHAVRLMARDEDERNAGAIRDMAVMRRGVEDHFFKVVPAAKYRNGDTL